MVRPDTHQLNAEERLMLSVVEQLSRPLVQIERLAELVTLTNDGCDSGHNATSWRTVQLLAAASQRLAESYSLSLRLNGKLSVVELEPITLSALLYDAAATLEPYAKQYGITLELDTGPRLAPVLADRTVLQSVLMSLGQVFVEAGGEQDEPATVRLAAHRGRYGAVAGLYSTFAELGADSLRQARQLQGKARQPMQRLTTGPGAGVFVADSLLASLQSHLHVARYHNLSGLAATLLPSQQLQLV